MIISQRDLQSEEQKKLFVAECEDRFAYTMDELTTAVLNDENERIITLSGPTCSGKTVTSNNVARVVKERGRRMKIVSIDDFYRPRVELEKEALEENRCVDFDSVRAIDIDLFEKVVEDIYSMKKTSLPHYDFKLGRCNSYSEVDPGEYDVFMFEGIQGVYPEVVDILDKYPYLSICTGVRRSLNVSGKSYRPREIRFMRLLVRDTRTRGSAPDDVFRLWEDTVIPNEDHTLLLYNNARICIDSLMEYEVNVLKEPVTEALMTISKTSEYYLAAQNIIEKIKDAVTISSDYIPKGSLYEEFLGRE